MRIYLGGYLDFYHPEKERWLTVELEQPAPLIDVLTRLDVPLAEIHLAAIDGDLVDLHAAILTNEDEVKLFSTGGGG